ncbi:MAG: hypothetical protein MJE68_04410, partial [Proteobacteria bacterium]|nr:hypothetical protein [Pseudomonadota bacterium]
NIAFGTIFADLLDDSSVVEPELHDNLDEVILSPSHFKVNLTLTYNASESIESLRKLHSAFAQNLSLLSHEDSLPYVLSTDYQNHMKQIQILVDQQDKDFAGLDNHFWSITSLFISLLNMITICLLIKRYERLQTVTATLTMLKTAKAYSLPDLFSAEQIPTTEKPTQAEVICYDPIISGVLTAISTLSVIIVIWQQWKNKNLCRGYLYTNTFEIKLILGEETRFLPLKLKKMAGPLHRVGVNRLPTPGRLRLIRNWLWDSLTIDWDGIEMISGHETVQLPNTIVVPLRAKFKVRQILSDQNFTVSMALTQDNNWYDLTHGHSCIFHTSSSDPDLPAGLTSSDTRPLIHLVNTR